MAQDRFDAYFRDTDGAIRFGTADMADAFREVVHGWPNEQAPENADPFVDVRQTASRWEIEIHRPEPVQKKHNVVNGICDLIVALNWSRLRQNTDLMCLHAAGVLMGASLVVFPNRRRAGKSTLTAELARRGHRVISDDILAMRIDDDGVPRVLSTGISPRLRLPLPPDASDRFCNWVEADPGPSNRQYKYLTKAPVADYGHSSPVSAIITLDRVDDELAPAFSAMDARDVLPVLIHQNFGRFAHAGRTLAAFSAIAHHLPCLKLTYSNFEQAASFLEDNMPIIGRQGAARAKTDHETIPDFTAQTPTFDATCAYRQRPGFQFIQTGDEAFVADAQGLGILRMGPGMLPVWQLLQEPMTADQIASVLDEVFPDVGRDTLDKDVRTALKQLNTARLIERHGD